MKAADYKVTLLTEQTPTEVFEAIINVRDWWTGYHNESFSGKTEKLNDEFSFHAGGGAHYSKQKLVEVIPNEKIVWLVTDSKLSFIDKTDEWVGTKVIFEISEKDGKTQLTFTHKGLTPDTACYDSCAPAWSEYLQNRLLPLINTGKVR